jgi:hypothetical protein
MLQQQSPIKKSMDFFLNFIPFVKSYPVWVQYVVSIWMISTAVIIVILIVQKPKGLISAPKETTVKQEAVINHSQGSNVYQAQRDIIINNPPQFSNKAEREKPIKIPKPNVSLILLPSNYLPDIEIDGIKWEQDFKEYIFTLRNVGADIDLEDLRIELQMPGGVVAYKLNSQEGCEGVTFPPQDTVGWIAGENQIISKTFDYYVNNLKINIVRLFPNGTISLKMIIKYLTEENEGGIFSLKCRHIDPDGKKVSHELVYKIIFKDINKKSLYIDESKPITGSYKGIFMMIPKKPLLFKGNS